MSKNEIGLNGIEFVEFSSPKPEHLKKLFREFGFSKILKHNKKNICLHKQGDINFLVNEEKGSFSEAFYQAHGPCVSSMGWRVHDAKKAFKHAVDNGAKPAERVDYHYNGEKTLAITGIGGSLIYFIDQPQFNHLYKAMDFSEINNPDLVKDKGFTKIDHLTNNVYKGTMSEWSDFYKNIFGFEEIRYFDIRGIKTGLTSFALKSPCGKFCIPINEGTEKKSQINEFLDEYKGPGVQHIAFLTDDLLQSLEKLEESAIDTLDIDKEYYDEVFTRVPNVSEDHKDIQKRNVLVDGDDEGYLLQIFTKNIVGPIFIEMIQRRNHFGFGEGNFSALFRAIERDQEKRGVL